MKKLILLFLFFTFFSKISFSQIVDQRLEKKYSKQEINKMIQDDPYKYHFPGADHYDGGCWISSE